MRNLYVNLAERFVRIRGPEFLRRGILPMKLTVASTFRCNHQCSICGIWRVYRENPAKVEEELSGEDYRNIFGQLKNSLLFLDWGGGEPFLRDDMCEIIRDAAAICPKLASFVITTNGLLGKRIERWVSDLARGLSRHRFSVGVSLDGCEPVHDRIRGMPGAFRSATETVERLKQAGRQCRNVEVKISYTLCSLNAGRFEEFAANVLHPLGMGAGDIGFNLEHVGNLFQTGASESETVGRVGAGEFLAGIRRDIQCALGMIAEERLPGEQKLKSVYRTFFLDRIPGYLDNPGKMVIPCEAARNSAYLDPYGNLYPCVVWNRQLGRADEGIEGVMTSQRAKDARRTIESAKCPICWNACEAIPSLLTSWRLAGCAARSLFRFQRRGWGRRI